MKYLNSPKIRQHVESHLVFGLLGQYVPTLFVAIAAYVIWKLYDGFVSPDLIANKVGTATNILVLCFFGYFFGRKLSKYDQAALCWLTVKITMGFLCFLILIAGVLNPTESDQEIPFKVTGKSHSK